MILHVLDDNFVYRGRLDAFRSIRWKEEYAGRGAFTLTVDDTPENAEILRRSSLFYRPERGTAMLPVYINRDGPRGSITVTGYTAQALLDRRVILGKIKVSNIESGIYQLINDNLRGLPAIETAPLQNLPQEWDTEFEDTDLLPAIYSLCEEGDLGVRMTLDYQRKRLVFQVYQGADHTYQADAGGVVFSTEFGNLLSLSVTEDGDIYKNVALVRGRKRDDSEILVTVGDASGLDRRELLVSGSAQEEGQTDAQYQAALETEGWEALQDYYDVTTFNAGVSPDTYGTRYILGDKVTCSSTRYGVRFDARISSVEETQDGGFEKLLITLGNPTITYAQSLLIKSKERK